MSTGHVFSKKRKPRLSVILWLVFLIFAFAFPYVVDRPKFWIPNIGIKTIWLGVIAMSLVFLNRYVGLLSLAQMTIAGISAYGAGFIVVKMDGSIMMAIPIGLLAGTLAGFLIALVAVRTKAIYFLMITLAIGQVVYSFASQSIEVTNARRGLAPIKRADAGFIHFTELHIFYYVALLVAIGCYILCRYTASTSFGLALQGIKDSPERMSALGYNVNRYRIGAMTFSSFIASVGGIIMVFDRAQVDPDVVALPATLDILIVAVVGGIGSLSGVFFGALVLTLLDNFSQNLTERYMTLTGLVFIAVLLFAPAGLAGIGKQLSALFARLKGPAIQDSAKADPPQTSPAATAEDAQETQDELSKGSQR